ncbi:MAG TPA: amino acid adenylation domain-containing protein, partial [Pseudonocardiaceae bacterium]|nr:amino acid adenylation domain-containing protein [Pseudonocardiaceae bacterium]
MTSLRTVSAALRVSGELDVVALAQATHELAGHGTPEPIFVDRTDESGRRPVDLLHDLIDAPWPDPQQPWRVFVVRLGADDHVVLLCSNLPSVDPHGLLDELIARYRDANSYALALDAAVSDRLSALSAERSVSLAEVLRTCVRDVLRACRGAGAPRVWLFDLDGRYSLMVDHAPGNVPIGQFAGRVRDALVDAVLDHANGMSLPELVEAAVRRTPQATALRWAQGELTYAELNLRANRLAHALIARGAGPGATVALLLPRSPELVIATLAVSKAGAAFLPIDPGYPAARISYLMNDARPLCVLTPKDVEAPGSGPSHDPADADRLAPLRLANIAYVIYTSGTTGQPKGVLVPHTGLRNFTEHQARRTGVGPGDRVLQYASPSFDASVLELLLALPTGACLVTPEPGPLLGLALAETLRRARITHTLIPPAALATIPPDAPALPDLRHLIVGGDATTADLVARWAPGRDLTNAYGPTEITIAATWSAPLAPTGEPPTIGTPLGNTRVHLLDAGLRPVPSGQTGEIYVDSPGIAHGYHNQPGLTAASFVANPFGPPGSRLYRTGDLAHRDPDGNLHYHGRTDHQTKIRGNRVELGEIRTALQRHGDVRQAVVTTHTSNGHTQLVGYVVPEAGRHCSPAELHDHLAGLLPDYMIPAVIMVIAELPLTHNGKVDHARLPEPEFAGAVVADPPRTATERALADIWCEVLGIGAAGVHDDFFRFGGDSILATKVLARVRLAFGAGLSVRVLFEHRTIAELAQLLPEPAAGTDVIPPAEVTGPAPLSAAQRRLWVLDDLTGGVEYNTGVGLRLTGPIDVDALRAAVAALVRRHAVLRTTFQTVDGVARQVVAGRAEVPVRVLDLPGASDALMDEVLAEELRTPFDLRTGPLSRFLLLRRSELDHVLVLCQHHIITDGASVRVLVEELIECYAAALRGEQARLPELDVQYADFAVWEQGRPVDGADLAYWRDTLAGLDVLELPTDRPRPAQRTVNGAICRRDLTGEMVTALAALGQEHDATLFMVLTAAVQVLLARYANQSDVAVGTAVSGRDRAELERVAGFFVNTLVLRSAVDRERSFQEFLGEVRETVLGAFAHGGVPFDKLVEELRPRRDPSRTPLVQVLVVLQNQLVRPAEVGGLRVGEQDLPRPGARFDLVIEFLPRDRGLNLAVEYNTDLFDAVTVERLTGHLEVLLTGIAANPACRVGELPMLTGAETARLLLAWNDTDQHVPASVLPALFEAQVARTPQATAIFDAAGNP